MTKYFFVVLYVRFIYKNYAVADKININPPETFLLHIASNYLKIQDTVLITHENSSIPVDDYAEFLHNNSVFTSIFQWKTSADYEEQFDTFIKVVSSGNHYRVVAFLDYESTEVFMKQAHLVRDKLLMVCFYRWIFFDFDGVEISQLYHPYTSGVCWRSIYVKRKDNQESEEIKFSLFGSNLQMDGNCVLEDPIGNWTSSKGMMNTTVFQKQIMNYQNITFPAAVLDEKPFYSKSEDGTHHEGMEYELMKTLRNRLNFSVDYIPNTDGQFGFKLPNGTWTGFIGLITSGKAIFSIATLSISNRRLQAVDFSSPYIFGKLSFVVLSPALESRKFVLIKPLQKEVWAALGTTLVVCTSVLYLITHSLPCKSGVRRSYNIWFLLRTLGQQGTPSPAPARYSIRFFISGWWFFIMVILWSYAGTLTSFMTYPGRQPAIDTIKKLQNALKSRSIRYGTTKGTTYEHFLMSDMAEVNPIFGQSLIENPEWLVKSVPQGMDMVLEGKYAFVYMKAVLKWFAATLGFDRFRFSKNVFSTEAIGIASQKCHPLKRSFDHIVDRLEETGLFSKWYKDAFVRASIQAPQVDIKNVRALSFDDVQGAFYFLCISLFFCTLVLLLEVVYAYITYCTKKTKRKKKRKKDFPVYGIMCAKHQQLLLQLPKTNKYIK